MDVIKLYNNQIYNCVANLGTALTNKQILLLGQFFQKLLFVLMEMKAAIKQL